MTLLGTGTSHGVPVIACDCAVCTSGDSKNKRMRSSALLEYDASYFHFVGNEKNKVDYGGNTNEMNDREKRRLKGLHGEYSYINPSPYDEGYVGISEAAYRKRGDKGIFSESTRKRHVGTKENRLENKGNAFAVNADDSRTGNKKYCFLLDVGPEFRMQALRAKIKWLDGVLVTHSHADHLHGLDDLRAFSNTCFPTSVPLPVYANDTTLQDIKERFSYIFKDTQLGGGKPNIELCPLTALKKFEKIGLSITPIDMLHGELHSSGYAFSSLGRDNLTHAIVYLTDCNKIEKPSIRKILDCADCIDFLVIDGLRKRPHTTHFCFLQALEAANEIGARHTYLTHLTHNSSHDEINDYITEHLNEFAGLRGIVASGGSVEAAYDSLVLSTP